MVPDKFLLTLPPRFLHLPPTTLAGQHQTMSLQADTTAELWRGFRQRQLARPFAGSAERYSVQVYGAKYFEAFNPATRFEKWAAVAVVDAAAVPADLATLVLPGGLYAVFGYQGPASAAPAVFGQLFGTWLPGSDYALDERPHFELLPPGYRPDDPGAREEVWLPVRPR